MPILETTVDTWSKLNDTLFEHSWSPSLGRYRSPYVFRGLGADYRLETSLMRLGGPYHDLEAPMLRAFRKYSQTLTEAISIWRLLAVAQHRGLPTRLLDWTWSPYVALHFATEQIDKFDCESVVWCVNVVDARESLPTALRQRLYDEHAYVFTVELLEQTVPTLGQFAGHADDVFAVFLEPPSIDDRIVNQYAVFSVLSDSTVPVDDWLGNSDVIARKIVIPPDSNLLWEIRDKLDQANISERMLFPGLDGLAKWLKRHYSPGPTSVDGLGVPG